MPPSPSHRHTFAQLLFHLYHHSPLHGKGDVHERSFEAFLRAHAPTLPYERHPNGTHRWPDFAIYLDDPCLRSSRSSRSSRSPLPVELKTTQSTTFHVGQTWPCADAIYVISAPKGTYLSMGRSLTRGYRREDWEDYQCRIKALPRPPWIYPRIDVRLPLPKDRERHLKEVLHELLQPTRRR